MISKVCKSFGLEGLNSIDIILPPKKKIILKLIDINARPGLSINLLSKIYRKKLLKGTNFLQTKTVFASTIFYCSNSLKINNSIETKLDAFKKKYDISELPYKKKKFQKKWPFILNSYTIKIN